jgi:ParB-like nuclease domain
MAQEATGGRGELMSSARKIHRSAVAKDRLVSLPINSVYPSPQNNEVYRPTRPDDPAIQELARSIRKFGLLEPIEITQDHYIVSGHRRHTACLLAGLRTVACRIADIYSYDPEFLSRLCEANRQRVKGFEEILREKVVCVDPQIAHLALIEQRKAKAAVSGEFLKLEGRKTRKKISKAKLPMLNAVITIVNNQREYWPLSDRSIHYDLLNDPPLRHASKPASRYTNSKESYKDLTDLLTRARLTGEIPFDAIADPTRMVCSWDLDNEVGTFIERELAEFFRGYARNRQQSQPNHIEIVGEKNTVESSIRDVAMEYCIPYTLGRGYCSLDPRRQMLERFEASGKERLIVLCLADFDPEGEDIAQSFALSMRDDFGVDNVLAQKVCLTHEQVLARDLPKSFDIKKTSSRYKKFAAKYGDRAHELESLSHLERSEMLSEAIRGLLDIEAYNKEVDAEKEDAGRLASLRSRAAEALAAALDSDEEGDSA